MILKLVIEHGKDASGIKKRAMWSNLSTNIKGMESIDSLSELDEVCVLGQEITKMVNFIVKKTKKRLIKDYMLKLHISKVKSSTKNVVRGMAAKLYLKDCIIDDFFELDKDSILDKEFIKLSTELLIIKKKQK